MLKIRAETEQDQSDISKVIADAFESHPFSDQREAQIVDSLRDDLALTISLVATIDSIVIAHISFSEVSINEEFCNWYGLAPVSVTPRHQNKGVGSKLVTEGLGQLKQLGAKGCVLLGEPDYYKRFGFKHYPELVLEGVPPEYFQALPFTRHLPTGRVKYHAAFG